MARLLSTSEVARLVTPPVARFTVDREIRRGHIKAKMVIGRWAIDEDEAQRWAAAYAPSNDPRKRGHGAAP